MEICLQNNPEYIQFDQKHKLHEGITTKKLAPFPKIKPEELPRSSRNDYSIKLLCLYDARNIS